jgi:hypothetical protein
MFDLPERISRLGPDDRRLLVERNPLSFAQERLWFLHRLAPHSSVYGGCLARRLIGALDTARLARAVSEIVGRHGVLRTTFPEIDGRPLQAVAPPRRLGLPVIDLTGLPAAERDAEARRIGLAMGTGRPDLARGPLFRASLLRLGDEDHVLIFTIHHIVADGWSGGILLRELATFYDAFRAGRQARLTPLPFQYADFARWERTRHDA